jgi:hypothetical protein
MSFPVKLFSVLQNVLFTGNLTRKNTKNDDLKDHRALHTFVKSELPAKKGRVLKR